MHRPVPTPTSSAPSPIPTRRALLDCLRAGARPVGDLATDFRTSRPAISKHLRVLRQARLVRERREGRLRR